MNELVATMVTTTGYAIVGASVIIGCIVAVGILAEGTTYFPPIRPNKRKPPAAPSAEVQQVDLPLVDTTKKRIADGMSTFGWR